MVDKQHFGPSALENIDPRHFQKSCQHFLPHYVALQTKADDLKRRQIVIFEAPI